MSISGEIEEKFNLKIDELNPEEKETYFKMLDVVQKSQMTPEKMRDYVVALREAVEKELIEEPEFNYIFLFKVPNRKQILLKARLKNYLLLESFLLSPEKARDQLEGMVSNIVKGRG